MGICLRTDDVVRHADVPLSTYNTSRYSGSSISASSPSVAAAGATVAAFLSMAMCEEEKEWLTVSLSTVYS